MLKGNIISEKLNLISLIKILFYTFPVSFIIGNFALSLNLFLFIVLGLVLIFKDKLNYRFNNLYWLLIFFFLYIFLLTLIQFKDLEFLYKTVPNWSVESHPILKSFIIIRYLILVFVIDALFYNKILKLEKFFFISLMCTSFVSLDIILQYLTGSDIFGFKSVLRWNSGPFGTETIAGSYLQKFSFLSIFYFFQFIKLKKFNSPFLIFFIVLHLLAMLLAGNKMPMLLFLFGCSIIVIFIKKLRFVTISSLIIFISIFFLIFKSDANINHSYNSFFKHINFLEKAVVVSEISEVKETDEKNSDNTGWSFYNNKKYTFLIGSGHQRLFRASFAMWKEQPLWGFGLKSFRVKCWEILPKINGLSCSTHPHNYYLELLSETGLVGTISILIFFIILLINSLNFLFKKNYKTKTEKYLIISMLIIFILEIWPLKSSGSFFTTGVATFIWLLIGMIFATTQKNTSIK